MKNPPETTSKKAKVTEVHRTEAALLRAIWDSTEHSSQAVFGETYGIGNQSAVGQFLRGEAALSMKAAKGFALGLGCQISAFSKRLAIEAEEVSKAAGSAFFPSLKNPISLTEAVDVLAERINAIEDPEHRELIAVRLQTMARAPDSDKARNGVLEAMAWPDAVMVAQKQKKEMPEKNQRSKAA